MSKAKISSESYNTIFNSHENESKKTNRIVIAVLLCFLIGLGGFFLGDSRLLRGGKSSGFFSSGNNADEYSVDELQKIINEKDFDFALYNQIVANLKDKYVDTDKVSDKALFEGSLKGLVDSIGDKATNYFNPKDYQDYLESFSGKFEGIGVRLDYKDGVVAVVDVIDNSPAKAAGVKEGFYFSKIEGKDVTSETIEQIVQKVRGDAGTKVKITFFDRVANKEFEAEITRASIETQSMRLIEKDKDTVVLEVSRFTEATYEEWETKWDQTVNELNRKGYKNVVLDLRGNGGGYLAAAIHAANDFIEPGKLIVSEKSRIRENVDTKSTNKTPRLKDKKLTILINEGTASASEILAGAIKFHRKDVQILGTRSYGKGTVQNTYNLPNKGALKITTEYWLLPDGKRLDNDNPIKPDKDVVQDANTVKDGKDTVLDEAIKLFN